MKKVIKILPIIILGLIPLIWFYGKGDALINGIDTNFPLDPYQWFVRRFFVWNNVFNAGSDFSSSISGIFFHLVQVIPYKLGMSLQLVEAFSLVFWFTAIVSSAYIFARVILPGSWLIQLLFVSLYAFNIYLFNSWENVKVSNLSLIASIPAALAVLAKLKTDEITPTRLGLFAVLIGIVLSGSGINPSYFFTFFLVIFIYLLGGFLANRGQLAYFTYIKKTAFFLVIILAVNAFWIIPTVTFIYGSISPAGSIDKLGLNNWIDSLSEHTSLLNVLRMQGAWDWYVFDGITGLPIFIPYALNYFYKLPFIVFSFLIPTLALTSFFKIDLQRRYLYISFGIMMVIGIFLGSGTHLPSGSFYRVLIDHVPFFTIFRSPWYIFTPLLIIAYAGLVSLLFYSLEKFKKYQAVVYFFVLITIAGNLLYSYPLVTGKIFRPGRVDSFFVNFPPYVFEAKKWLDHHDYGRIITYPDDEIEQFEWGYRGIESILSLLSNREFLYSSLNAPDAPISKLVTEFYKSLKAGEVELSANLAYKMGVGVIFEKKDQKSLSPKIPVGITDDVYASFNQWHFYKFPKDSLPSKLQSPTTVFYGYPYSSISTRLIGLLERDALLVNPDDTVYRKIKGLADITKAVIRTENSQARELTNFGNSPSRHDNRLLTRDMSKVDFNFNVQKESFYKPVLDRYRLEDFGLHVSVDKSIEFEFDGKRQTWEIEKITNSFVFFKPLLVTKGQHKAVLKIDNKNLILGGDFEGIEGFKRNGNGEYTISIEGSSTGGRILSIANRNSGAPEASADFNILSVDPLRSYLIEVKYQQIYGNTASVIVYQGNANTLIKAQTEGLPNYPEFNTFSFYFEPVKTDSTMRVSLLAPYIKDPLGTKVLYDDLRVVKVFTNQMFFIEFGEPKLLPKVKTNIKKISPVLYEVEVDGGSQPHILSFAENYSPQWDISLYHDSGSRLNIKPSHFSANLFANAWYIEGAPEKYKAKISYSHQKLLILGYLISIFTLLVILVRIIFRPLKRLLNKK